MLIHDVHQGTTEWLQIRAGIPTASSFDKIITKSGKPSAQAEQYLYRLLAERMIGRNIVEHVSYWMDRGNQMEAEAISYYEGIRDLDTVRVGFVTNDECTIGASPDRLVGGDGLLEVKCPAEHTHVAYMLNRSVDEKYYPQIQGQLWVSGRAWVDILSYHPEMPPALIRVERDEKFITALAAAVTAFSAQLEEASADARARGWLA